MKKKKRDDNRLSRIEKAILGVFTMTFIALVFLCMYIFVLVFVLGDLEPINVHGLAPR